MKSLLFVLTTIFLFSCGSDDKENSEKSTFKRSGNYVAILDFHTDHRCKSCVTIEKLTKETLQENFKSELIDSTIVFSLINVDAAENKTIAEEYEAFGTSLMISVFKNGEEEVLDLTEWAFEAIHGDDFKTELKNEIKEALKKL